MKRASLSLVLGFLTIAVSVQGTEARVMAVRSGSGGSPALLLKVPDNAELSAQDVSALLDAAGSRGSTAGSERVKAAVNGRRFGEVAVVAPPKPRVIEPVRKRASPAVAKISEPKPQPTPVKKPAPPVKPDVTIFDPAAPKKPEVPAPLPDAPQEQPEPKKP